jgi:hypothetical protein
MDLQLPPVRRGCLRPVRETPGVVRNIAVMRGLCGAVLALGLTTLSARAARPLLDQHQWDRYFALSARDVEVPWKPASFRLAVYSGAPVDFAVYNIDPAEVIIAGQHRSARAIDVRGRRPLARWRFTPPAGYRFEVNQVLAPLGSQEGFYVVEARRGAARQQVWINRTHIGLVTKESPGGLLLWCVDLRTGQALRGVNVAFLVGRELLSKETDARGAIVWTEKARPSFALADYGAARAFVSFLPQAPLPSTIVGIRLESAGARAGEDVRFIGFVRRRVAGDYRRAGGEVRVALIGRGKTAAQTSARLDSAGAYSGVLHVPRDADSGQYAVLAAVGGEGASSVGGTSLHVDAGKSVVLAIRTNCPCSSTESAVLKIFARGEHEVVANLPIVVRVVRVPHIIPPGEADDAPRWGTTLVYEKTVRTDEHGAARVRLLAPEDGLASSYGVSARSDGATATTRVTVATSSTALAVEPDADRIGSAEEAGFTVRGFDAADGAPAAHLRVFVRLMHGASASEKETVLDEHGRARVVFKAPSLGTNLVLAKAQGADGRRALDATAVSVDPAYRDTGAAGRASSWKIVLNRDHYQAGDQIGVSATVPGATGDAFVTLEGERVYQMRIVKIENGRAETRLKLPDAQGDVRVGVAAVRDGAVVLGSVPAAIDAPGHVHEIHVTLDRASFHPGDQARIKIGDGGVSGKATVLVRIADGRESAQAYLDDVPDLLKVGGTTTQNPAAGDPAWHAFAAPPNSQAADIYTAERPRTQSTEDAALTVEAPRTLLWRVERDENGKLSVPLPGERGRYVLSLLCIGDDGSVGASSTSVNVQ